ncbi:MAG TPA: hypothetical protein VI670_27820 [Thermoanaerobaculia bacterium]
MDQSALSLVNAIIGGVNLATLMLIAFKGGHWMGRVEARLDALELRRGHRADDHR